MLVDVSCFFKYLLNTERVLPALSQVLQAVPITMDVLTFQP